MPATSLLRTLSLSATLLCFAIPLAAQNLVPEGDFEAGGSTWTLASFNDPLGTTGFAPARVTGNGPSSAMFASFNTLTSVMNATYDSQPFTLASTSEAAGFAVMWEKQVTAPIPSVSVNRVELRVFDITGIMVFSVQRPAPNQTGLLERATWNGVVTVPAPGVYTAQLFLRHSNLAGIPYTTWVDDLYIGSPSTVHFGQGCAGSGGITPVMHGVGSPQIGNATYAVGLFDAAPTTVALLAIGFSNSVWSGGALPFALGAGCSLSVDPAVLFVHVTGGVNPGEGAAAQTISIPASAGLQGVQLYSQWGVFDAAVANALTIATTAGMLVVVQ